MYIIRNTYITSQGHLDNAEDNERYKYTMLLQTIYKGGIYAHTERVIWTKSRSPAESQ